MFNQLQPASTELIQAVEIKDTGAIQRTLDALNPQIDQVEQLEEATGALADQSIAAADAAANTGFAWPSRMPVSRLLFCSCWCR